jgi:hypothetical protein
MKNHDTPELVQRRQVAAAAQKGDGEIVMALHDPIEDDEAFTSIIKEARKEAESLIDSRLGMGRCHSIWARMKKILKEKHGIVWYTPAEMNPLVCFD